MKNIKEVQVFLLKIEVILKKENELNWSRGINAALNHLKNETEEGYMLSKSVYKTMCSGGRGFMEYYIKKTDTEEQKIANENLDLARNRLWNLFDY